MLTQQVARKRDARRLEDACALVNTPWQLGRRHRIFLSLSSAESEYHSVGTLCGVRPSGWLTRYESWARGSRTNPDRCCSSTRAGSAQREQRHQTHGDEEVLWATADREEPLAQGREDPWHSQPRRLDDEAPGWKTFGDVV